jgi:hypothetical protein
VFIHTVVKVLVLVVVAVACHAVAHKPEQKVGKVQKGLSSSSLILTIILPKTPAAILSQAQKLFVFF